MYIFLNLYNFIVIIIKIYSVCCIFLFIIHLKIHGLGKFLNVQMFIKKKFEFMKN